MFTGRMQSLVLMAVVAAAVAACNAKAPAALRGFLQCAAELPALHATVAKSAGVRQDYIEILGSQARLQIGLSDPSLVAADATARVQAATAIVAATERALTQHAGCAGVGAISVAIFHPSGRDQPLREWHTEDVIEFRRGPGLRFAVQAP